MNEKPNIFKQQNLYTKKNFLFSQGIFVLFQHFTVWLALFKLKSSSKINFIQFFLPGYIWRNITGQHFRFLQLIEEGMKESSQKILRYLNLAREHPAYYVSILDKQISSFLNEYQMPLTNDIVYETNEGKNAWIEARNFLLSQKPLPPFIINEGLTRSAEAHKEDICLNGIYGHEGSDGSTFSDRILRHCKKGSGAMAEIIGADFDLEERNTYEMTVLGLIVDDGVIQRGHRSTIFNAKYKYIGFSCGQKDEKIITVFNFTEKDLQPVYQRKNHLRQKSSTSNNTTKIQDWQNSNKTERLNITKKIKKNLSKENFYALPKKIIEKCENTHTYYIDGAKFIEKTTKLVYSDGTYEQSAEKKTFYTDSIHA